MQTKNYSVLSTGTPTYWPTNPRKIPDLLYFFIISGYSPSYADIQPSYDLSSDYTSIITTLSTILMTKRPTRRLHNSRSDCHRYISEISNQVNGGRIYRMSQKERTKFREGVPYVKVYRYNPKHLYPKMNGYGDNGQRSLKL